MAPYPLNPSSSLGRWAQAEKAESIGEGREVWIGGRMAMIEKGKTWSKQAKAVGEEEESWVATSLAHPSPAGPQSGRISFPGASS